MIPVIDVTHRISTPLAAHDHTYPTLHDSLQALAQGFCDSLWWLQNGEQAAPVPGNCHHRHKDAHGTLPDCETNDQGAYYYTLPQSTGTKVIRWIARHGALSISAHRALFPPFPTNYIQQFSTSPCDLQRRLIGRQHLATCGRATVGSGWELRPSRGSWGGRRPESLIATLMWTTARLPTYGLCT